jgi:phenylpropionate dioxygenase-like ring-hydroxylating dioxygenase large terminal subunit
MASELRWASKYPELGTGPMPVEPYISNEYAELEKEQIFRRVWLNVGRSDDLPTPGSYFVREIEVCGASVLVTRGSDDVIRAFHNVCSHRGNKLVWEERGACRGYLSCCFHGWTYDLQGQLKGVLDEENFHNLERDKLGLTPLTTETWKGWIFIHFQEDPPETLEEYLGGLTEELGRHDLDQLALSFRFDVEDSANWKVAIDAQNEIYHLPILGPVHGAFTDLLETNDEGCTRFSNFKRFGKHTVYATDGNPDYVPEGVDKLLGEVAVTPLDLPTNGLFDFYVLFPNMVVAFLPDMMFTYNFWPLGVDRTMWEIRFHFVKPRSAAELAVQHYRKTQLRDALAEDISGHENVHRGLASRAKSVFLLQDEEVQIRTFHENWHEFMNGAPVPAGR